MDVNELYGMAASVWVVWFFVLFAGIVFWAYRPRRRKDLESHARIPLRDDDR